MSRQVPDHDDFLRALELSPGDDASWLAYAEWLERRGEPAAKQLRQAIGDEKWSHCRYELFRQLDRRKQRLVACDCIERLLPLYERTYPNDLRPRKFIEVHRNCTFRDFLHSTRRG